MKASFLQGKLVVCSRLIFAPQVDNGRLFAERLSPAPLQSAG